MNDLIKCFSIDVNSDPLGLPSTPGLYAEASPAAQVGWCRELGANAIQTFCVSLNGYAWYRSQLAPVTPGMSGDYLKEMIELGHREGMAVHGYFCLAGNAWFRSRHRDHLCSAIDWRKNIPLTTRYLDYFCPIAAEAVRENELDGVLIDWFEEIVPLWIPAEKQLYEEVMGQPFPTKPTGRFRPMPGVDVGETVIPEYLPVEEELAFRRAATIRAWDRVHDAIKTARPACNIWLNIPFHEPAEPIWADSPILREVDLMLTERCDLKISRWLHEETGGKPVLVNLGGLGRYEIQSWREIVEAGYHLYAYAKPDPETCLPKLESLARLGQVREAFGEA